MKVFISYSHLDELYRKELDKHLSVLNRNGYIDTWTDRKITPGRDWSNTISEELLAAKIILLLISSDFLASDYCYDIEMKTAMHRHDTHEAVVIPIILRFCDWNNTPFSKLQGLPPDGKPVKDWDDMDKAFLYVVEGIKAAINSITIVEEQHDHRTFGTSAEEQLAALRKRAFHAKGSRDYRKLLFELKEFKRLHPFNFDVEGVELLVKNGLAYEENKSIPDPEPASTRGMGMITFITLIVLLALGIYLVIRSV